MQSTKQYLEIQNEDYTVCSHEILKNTSSCLTQALNGSSRKQVVASDKQKGGYPLLAVTILIILVCLFILHGQYSLPLPCSALVCLGCKIIGHIHIDLKISSLCKS